MHLEIQLAYMIKGLGACWYSVFNGGLITEDTESRWPTFDVQLFYQLRTLYTIASQVSSGINLFLFFRSPLLFQVIFLPHVNIPTRKKELLQLAPMIKLVTKLCGSQDVCVTRFCSEHIMCSSVRQWVRIVDCVTFVSDLVDFFQNSLVRNWKDFVETHRLLKWYIVRYELFPFFYKILGSVLGCFDREKSVLLENIELRGVLVGKARIEQDGYTTFN